MGNIDHEHAPPVVDPNIRSCASVSRGKYVSKLPIGAMGGTFVDWPFSRPLRHEPPVNELTETSFAVVQARVEASTSAMFPSGWWGLLTI